jgi:hypothetical protein
LLLTTSAKNRAIPAKKTTGMTATGTFEPIKLRPKQYKNTFYSPAFPLLSLCPVVQMLLIFAVCGICLDMSAI